MRYNDIVFTVRIYNLLPIKKRHKKGQQIKNTFFSLFHASVSKLSYKKSHVTSSFICSFYFGKAAKKTVCFSFLRERGVATKTQKQHSLNNNTLSLVVSVPMQKKREREGNNCLFTKYQTPPSSSTNRLNFVLRK